ncbi:2Fe-2S iron-sulfur cluster-binding protein [Desertivirga xinjiangensis]|uniref:2Fe-2S iron-sulfur cluster-binding protein n=1 Tax=Desertivirga xinjiangensis TaxID=539206 RepID=UPI00210F0518|nr:2Fe-2S iron-sulfur cluster-binding protein [Pedobacter xinjiangensis]
MMDSNSRLHFSIVAIKQETPSARTYELKLLNEGKMEFKPGQFLTFLIHTENHEIRRSYSILSLPGEPVKITVKKVENGAISRLILQTWKVGDIVYSLPPAGRFSVEPGSTYRRDIFCFAAGSGIIPILPQVKYLLNAEPQSIIHLIYSNKDEDNSLFLEEIETLDHRYENLTLLNFFSDPGNRVKERGRLSNLNVEPLIERLLVFKKEDALFLICGPFAYMRMLNFVLMLMHFPKENIRRENFLPEIMRAGQAVNRHFPERQIFLTLTGQTTQLVVRSGEDILSAAQRQGLNPPYSCKGGICGNCAAKCKVGKVYMSINEVLTETDLQQGWVLTCTGFPETENVVIDFSES